MKFLKVTPVLVVSNVVEESKFWHKLGFATVAEVPHGETIGFAILNSDSSEIMLQTVESLAGDMKSVADSLGPKKSYLFADVDNLDDFKIATKNDKLLVPERKTFYGTKEIFVQTASGEIIGFAQKL